MTPTREPIARAPAPILTVGVLRRWSALAILLVFNVLGFIDRSIVSLIVQPVKIDLALTDVQIGFVQGLAFAFFYAVCGIPIGWALDRFPKKPIVFAGILIWSFAAAACGLARNFEHLLIARFFVGMGEATLVPASYAILSGLFPREQLARVLSIFSLGTAIGMAIAMLAGGALIEFMTIQAATPGDHIAPWRMVFFLTGLPGIVVAALVFLVPEVSRKDTTGRRAGDAGFSEFLRTRMAFLICHNLGIATICLTAVSVAAWLPTYFVRHHHWTSPQAASAMATSTVLSVIATLVGAVMVDRMFKRGRKNAHMLLQAILVPIATVLGASAFLFDLPFVQLMLIGSSLALLSITGIGASALQLVTPVEYRARISAIYLMLYGLLGNGLGPLVTAFFTDYLYRDESRLGDAMMTSILIFGPVSAVLMIFASRYMRPAIDRLEAEGGVEYLAPGELEGGPALADGPQR